VRVALHSFITPPPFFMRVCVSSSLSAIRSYVVFSFTSNRVLYSTVSSLIACLDYDTRVLVGSPTYTAILILGIERSAWTKLMRTHVRSVRYSV
jgi:hypothetical protein